MVMRFSIGTRIRGARHERGWSQVHLAYYSGVGCADISKIEVGRLLPTPAQVRRLADALDVPLDALLREVEGAARSAWP